jgi:hypothetical protein
MLSACASCHQEITIIQQRLDFTGMTPTEAKPFKLSQKPKRVQADGYY